MRRRRCWLLELSRDFQRILCEIGIEILDVSSGVLWVPDHVVSAVSDEQYCVDVHVMCCEIV